ncbi:hypothetical protein NC653_040419 [Populus alba x Populus x berolinensis]|uniref:Uncharacterized protein n=1 Tax=Populus alba x Populus x berolinensis TaxID=444605 RepID=A0AAD6LE81_9ROSI|nr:hypothetical protein NC653_040419 [Populus alba x Populus x berolinensis]
MAIMRSVRILVERCLVLITIANQFGETPMLPACWIYADTEIDGAFNHIQTRKMRA